MRANTRRFGVLVQCAIALMVLLPGGTTPAFAQGKTSAVEKEGTREGPSDGIKVHGHWTIDVKNPDGSLASHHDFENALTTQGADVLARLLGRVDTAVGWEVDLLLSAGA